MAQRTVTTSGMTTGDFSSSISNASARFQDGEDITTADIAELERLYNVWVGHKHNVQDYYYVRYGNKYRHNTTIVNDSTSTPSGASTSNIPKSGVVYASHINQLVSKINSIRSHTHTINDNWY